MCDFYFYTGAVQSWLLTLFRTVACSTLVIVQIVSMCSIPPFNRFGQSGTEPSGDVHPIILLVLNPGYACPYF